MYKLETRHITKAYENVNTIEDVSITLGEHEIVGLLGTSGTGKTTLFNVIAGLLTPESGQVFLNDNEITGEAGHISYMLQKDLMLPYRTIEDNVALPLLIKGEKKKAAREQVQPYFEEFGLAGTQKKYPNQLSGGMRQRAALLRTYMFSQDVALLDEPFSALDTITKTNMHKWYLEVMEQIQLSTVFITHDIDEAIILSDRIYIMAGTPGKIVKEIKVEQAKPRPDDFVLSEQFIEYKRQIREILAKNQ